MPTTPEAAEKMIRANINVQRSMVATAKDFIVRSLGNPTTAESGLCTSLLSKLLHSLHVAQPLKVVLHDSVPLEPQTQAVANYFSWQLAFVEGIWELIHHGVVLVKRADMTELEDHQEWTSVVPGSGGSSAGWSFAELRIMFPRQVKLALSHSGETQVLADGDLFLNNLAIPNLRPEIATFLHQAVECFRYNLYLPAIVMLGSASEGVWNELGFALLRYANSKSPQPPIIAKHREPLEDADAGIAHKINAIVDFYQVRQDIFSDLKKKLQISPEVLKSVSVWAHTIRDGRNALHGGGSSIPHTYESVAILLLSTPSNLRTLCALSSTASTLSGIVAASTP